METITLNLYKFSELSEDAKKKAIEKHCDINVEHEWWDCIQWDAKKVIGVEISGFDIYRKSIDIKFIENADVVAKNIMENFGIDTDIYRRANDYLIEYNKLKEKQTFDEYGESEQDDDIDDMEKEFLHVLGEEYLSMLEKDYDWLTSDEAIAETIEINEYDFLENGKRY